MGASAKEHLQEHLRKKLDDKDDQSTTAFCCFSFPSKFGKNSSKFQAMPHSVRKNVTQGLSLLTVCMQCVLESRSRAEHACAGHMRLYVVPVAAPVWCPWRMSCARILLQPWTAAWTCMM